MKKKLLTLMIALMAIVIHAAPVEVMNYDFKQDGICYKINSDDNTVFVTENGYSYDNSTQTVNHNIYGTNSGTLVIPATVTNEGTTYTVTGVYFAAFRECDWLQSVTFPNTITSLDGDLFADCKQHLQCVVLPQSMTELKAMFEGCEVLESVTMPTSLTEIKPCTFLNCIGVDSVSMGNRISVVGSQTFAGCNGNSKIDVTDVNVIINIMLGKM